MQNVGIWVQKIWEYYSRRKDVGWFSVQLCPYQFFPDILLRISNKQGENHFPIVGTVVYCRFLKWNNYMKVLEE